MDGCGGVGVREPATGIAPTKQQGQIQGSRAGIDEAPAKHGHRIAGALIVPRQDGTESLTDGFHREDIAVMSLADRITGRVGASRSRSRGLGIAQRIPAPGTKWNLGRFGPRIIPNRCLRQGMGDAPLAIVLKQGELAIRQHSKPVFAAIEVPKIEDAIRGPGDASGPEAPQGHAVVGAVIQVAGVAHRVGPLPNLTQGPLPAGERRLPERFLCRTRRAEAGETERRHRSGALGGQLVRAGAA